MTQTPLVTVIIPCFNYGKFLREAVASVSSQTYSNWECLIVDDGSTDDTKQIANDLCEKDRRVVYHYKTNGGLSSARNFGIALAKGEFICFLDTDDLLDKQKLQSQLDCFRKFPEADIVYGNFRYFETENPEVLYTSKNKTVNDTFPSVTGGGGVVLKWLIKQNITVVSAPLLRKGIFDRVGTFDESYRSYEDWHFWLRCAMNSCNFRYCNEPAVCTYIRFGHESMMSNKKKMLGASIQLRKFLQRNLPLQFRLYNLYRLLRSRVKLLLT